MKNLTTIVLFFSTIFFLNAADYNKYLFKGTIGKYSIVMQLDYNTETKKYFECSYYYVSQKKIIRINKFSIKDGKLNIVDLYGNNEAFSIQKESDGIWRGTWTLGDKRLPVVLSPVNVNTITHNFSNMSKIQQWKNDFPLSYYLTSKIEFKQDTITQSNNNPIYWNVDNIAGLHFFRVSAEYKSTNVLLLEKHLELVLNAINSCSCDGDEDKVFDVFFIKKSILSYNHSKSICVCIGGAHPFRGYDAETIDVIKGKIIEFEDLFTFSSNVPNKETQRKEWSIYQETKVSAVIIEWLRKTQPDLLETPVNIEEKDKRMEIGDCFYLDNNIRNRIERWFLTNKGIILVYFDGATGYAPCANSFEIPYSYTNPYLSATYAPYFK